MALHVLLVVYFPSVRDSARQSFNHEMTCASWRQYSVPFTWTKEFRDDQLASIEPAARRAEVETLVLEELHAALASAGSPTYSALIQVGAEGALADPAGWDRMTGA